MKIIGFNTESIEKLAGGALIVGTGKQPSSLSQEDFRNQGIGEQKALQSEPDPG